MFQLFGPRMIDRYRLRLGRQLASPLDRSVSYCTLRTSTASISADIEGSATRNDNMNGNSKSDASGALADGSIRLKPEDE